MTVCMVLQQFLFSFYLHSDLRMDGELQWRATVTASVSRTTVSISVVHHLPPGFSSTLIALITDHPQSRASHHNEHMDIATLSEDLSWL